MGEELELGPTPPTVQLEEAGGRIPWASSGASPGRYALVTSWAKANGGGRHRAGARGWCRSGRCYGQRGQLFAILSWTALVLPVVEGVAVLFGGHVWRGWTCTAVPNRQTNFGHLLVSFLGLSCTQTHRTQWARSCSMPCN